MERALGKTFDLTRFLATAPGGPTHERYGRKRTLFSQGDPADTVYYIQQGEVALAVISRQGKEAVISILGPGDFFGEGCLAGQTTRTATATTVTSCSLIRIDKQAMIRLLQTEPDFSRHFLSYLLARNARMQEDLVDQLFNSSEKRLARVLLLLGRLGNGGSTQGVVPRVSQQVLADMIGTTRSRVSYFMNKFRRQGFVEYSKEFRINSSLLDSFLRD